MRGKYSSLILPVRAKLDSVVGSDPYPAALLVKVSYTCSK